MLLIFHSCQNKTMDESRWKWVLMKTYILSFIPNQHQKQLTIVNWVVVSSVSLRTNKNDYSITLHKQFNGLLTMINYPQILLFHLCLCSEMFLRNFISGALVLCRQKSIETFSVLELAYNEIEHFFNTNKEFTCFN